MAQSTVCSDISVHLLEANLIMSVLGLKFISTFPLPETWEAHEDLVPGDFPTDFSRARPQILMILPAFSGGTDD